MPKWLSGSQVSQVLSGLQSDLSTLRVPKRLSNLSFLKSLVTDKMNKIFPCLAWYGLKLIFVVWKSRQNLTQPAGKGATKIKRQRIVLKTIFTIQFNQFLFVYTSAVIKSIFLRNTLCFYRSEWITNNWFQQTCNKWLVNNKI